MATQELVAARYAVQACLADMPEGAHVLVACSGGPDSLALAAVAQWVGHRRGIRVGAVIVDHALQHDSHAVAAHAAGLCRELGLDPVIVTRVEVGTEGGPEMAARTARYEALEDVASSESAQCVLLGHTRDDQAETVLLRLARGSGARSLSAMAPVTGIYRRPFLDLARRHVHALLKEMSLTAWTDPHNSDDAYARVRVRRSLDAVTDALGEGVVTGLARSAALLRDDADALDDAAMRAYVDAASVIDDGESGIDLDIESLECEPRAIRTRTIKMALTACGCAEAEAVHILAVDALISDWHGQGALDLPAGVNARRAYGRLEFRTGRSARG